MRTGDGYSIWPEALDLDAHRKKCYIYTEFNARREPTMNITKDISPLTEFKRDSARLPRGQTSG